MDLALIAFGSQQSGNTTRDIQHAAANRSSRVECSSFNLIMLEQFPEPLLADLTGGICTNRSESLHH